MRHEHHIAHMHIRSEVRVMLSLPSLCIRSHFLSFFALVPRRGSGLENPSLSVSRYLLSRCSKCPTSQPPPRRTHPSAPGAEPAHPGLSSHALRSVPQQSPQTLRPTSHPYPRRHSFSSQPPPARPMQRLASHPRALASAPQVAGGSASVSNPWNVLRRAGSRSHLLAVRCGHQSAGLLAGTPFVLRGGWSGVASDGEVERASRCQSGTRGARTVWLRHNVSLRACGDLTGPRCRVTERRRFCASATLRGLFMLSMTLG
ncbi:hypothetical protein BU16DRAFT_247500 [Lophium mytilinum]|uniref:Uncharacterized protein n=1 Tax=Lophium mytilinum TaxID=390894 RepID=A0A6A6R6N4_9PEZI|nr:hypothetical protein BU16DRAFT_247500 [Lophium mytilinum]